MMTNQKNEPQGQQPLTTLPESTLSQVNQASYSLPKNSNLLLGTLGIERNNFVQIIDWQATSTVCMTAFRRGDLLAHLILEKHRLSVVLIGLNNQPHAEAAQVTKMLTGHGIHGTFKTGGRDAPN